MRKPHRRLALRSETLRHLTSAQLARVGGGTEELAIADAAAIADGALGFGPKTTRPACNMDTAPKTNACTTIIDELTRMLTLKCP